MTTLEYLRYIVEEIHTVIVATIDGEGLPVTAAKNRLGFDALYLKRGDNDEKQI